jgi:hypothetical protein
MGIRQQLIRDNAQTIESIKNFGLRVVLTSPDGVKQDKSALDETRPLAGRITYSHYADDIDGNEIVCRNPTVTLSINSLVRVPAADEKWLVQIPPNPDSDELSDYTYERPPLLARALGRVKLFLEIVEQS